MNKFLYGLLFVDFLWGSTGFCMEYSRMDVRMVCKFVEASLAKFYKVKL